MILKLERRLLLGRKKIDYINAKDVLTKELLDKLYELNLSGMYLYVPSQKSRDREQKYAYIYYLREEEGLSIPDIADKVHLSKRRVEQILRYYSDRYPDLL